jgi:hypothetical protein
MYLDSTFIRAHLQRHGLWEEGDRCYVSCEAGCGKEDGRGFRLMAGVEAVPLQSVLHRGNDPKTDVAAARRVGVRVEPFLEGNLNRYEEALASHSYATGGLASIMAGASRLARLSVPASSTRESALRDVAASIIGPAVVSYLLWVLSKSREAGIRTLDFQPTTDSLLLRVAESLRVTLEHDCQIVQSKIGRAKPGEGEQELPSLPGDELPAPQPDRALVRAGMVGTVDGTLRWVAKQEGEAAPVIFAFARFARADDSANHQSAPVHVFFSDHVRRLGHLECLDETQLELLLGATAGRSATAPIVHETIMSFTKTLWLQPDLLDLTADMRPAIAEGLNVFFRSPSVDEARAWVIPEKGRGVWKRLNTAAHRLRRKVLAFR